MEVSILSRLHHPGIIKLLGVCVDGDQRIAVFELLSRGSLSSALGNSNDSESARSAGGRDLSKQLSQVLTWQQRMQIALGLAQGLAYMHQVWLITCHWPIPCFLTPACKVSSPLWVLLSSEY